MYGLPTDFDAAIFLGRRLETVTYSENVIGLSFGDGLRVSIYGPLRYQETKKGPPTIERPPVAHSSLVKMVGREVETADVKSPRELVLGFEHGATMTLLDDSDMYESYLLEIDGCEVVV